MSADKRYTITVEDARLFRVAPCKANQIFVKIYLEGSRKGRETKAATHNGDKFIFINESAEIEVDSGVSSPTVVVVKVMQAGLLRNTRVGKLKIKLPETLPFERVPVMPNELRDRQGEVVGTIGIHLMLKSMTGNYMAIQMKKKPEPIAGPETQMTGATMLDCTTFTSMDSSGFGSIGCPPSEHSSNSSSRASHLVIIGQPQNSLARDGAFVNEVIRQDVLNRSSLQPGRSLPPLKPHRTQTTALNGSMMQPTFDRNITHHSNETVSTMLSRGSAQSGASIDRFSTTSTDDYPLSPSADPPKYMAGQGNIDLSNESVHALSGFQSLPPNISIPERFPLINNSPDVPGSETQYSARFPKMD